jgi:hypothetical protein
VAASVTTALFKTIVGGHGGVSWCSYSGALFFCHCCVRGGGPLVRGDRAGCIIAV